MKQPRLSKSIVKIQLRHAGFTLVELLLAIMILGIVTVIIGSGFRLGVKAWERGEAETYETQRLRIVSGLMSQQLKSVYPYKMKVDEEDVTVFKGEIDSILFVTAFTNEGGLKWVRYSFKDGTLLIKEGILPDKNFLEKIDSDSGDEDVIDRNISDFRLEYLSGSDGWKESWDMGKDTPKAVRVKVAYFQPFLITIPMGLKGNKDTS